MKELNAARLTVTFYDDAKQLVVPTSGSYRIDEPISGAEIVGDTAFTPQTSTYVIEITAQQNKILDQSKSTERRTVTVQWTFGMDKTGSAEFEYELENLRFKAVVKRLEIDDMTFTFTSAGLVIP